MLLHHKPKCVFLFLDEFMSFSGFISSLPSQTIISGDFNIHFDTVCSSSCNFKSMLDSCNLVQHIDFPTHIHGHTLDFLITSSDFTVDNVCSMDCISDHFCVGFKLNISSAPKPPAKHVTFRQYHKIDRDQMKHDLENKAFVMSPSDNVTDLHDQYISSLSSILDKHAQLKTKCLSKPAPVWTTQQYRNAKRLRRQLERS